MEPFPLVQPPRSKAIVLCWADLLYSMRRTTHKDGSINPISFNYFRQIRSAASWCHALELANTHPGCLMRDRYKRGMMMPTLVPSDDITLTFSHAGMARRMGTEARPSWALAHAHIAHMDSALDKLFQQATTVDQRHELACAGTCNLMCYLGWLRASEGLSLSPHDVTLILPVDGPTRGLPSGVGAVLLWLRESTKTDRTVTADVVISYTTLSGLSLGKWITRLYIFTGYHPGLLFSTRLTLVWTSHHFRATCAHPLLERQRLSGEPTLRVFSSKPGQRIKDKVHSMHSWKRGGRSRVSRDPRPNEPNPTGARRARQQEIHEHSRWTVPLSSENMPRRYNQWDLADRICLTLFCV